MNELTLAIETSTPIGSVAVGRGGTVLAEIVLGEKSKHSELLLPAIEFALRTAGAEKTEVRAIVVGGGPGSFTGLRISAATAKALARSLEAPLYAYSGLCALAAGVGNAERAVCALFDARRGEVYAACYRFPGFERVETLLEPAPRHVDDVLMDARETIYVGDGALQNSAPIVEAGGTIAPAHLAAPRASALLWLQHVMPQAGLVEDLPSWEPQYLRDSGAQRMRAQ
ncbi:MAG TPA: tRNA (adenosine(37)-N6)-threonylcarbamoyltransferase complex dimerization subunit type 1 TsaB [Longimicrobiales bacterium]|nr:tRNA (adenosine(37)-N6)-threonylcarbamoyltransferase complex dimerization subunit type 1 TsaB [Longimicrobiales bacterium]